MMGMELAMAYLNALSLRLYGLAQGNNRHSRFPLSLFTSNCMTCSISLKMGTWNALIKTANSSIKEKIT
jgi:hypothetical protein